MKKDLTVQYDNIAKLHQILRKKTREIANRIFIETMPAMKDKTVLDLGCGSGEDLQACQKLGAKKLIGLDSSSEKINLAHQLVPNTQLFTCDFEEKIPLTDTSVDCVISRYAIQTAYNLESIFKEINRVLKFGGFFHVLVTHPLRQFMEKEKKVKNYFQQEVVKSTFLNGQITIEEPTHTFLEYLSPYMLKHFDLLYYDEQFEPSVKQIDGCTYPAYSLFTFQKR